MTSEMQLHVQRINDVLFEEYTYSAGPPRATPPHAHEEYQLCISVNFPGEYTYRRTRYPVPAGSLSVFHPGELHSSRDLQYRSINSLFLLFYIPPTLVYRAARNMSNRPDSTLFFPNPILNEARAIRPWLRLYKAMQDNASVLEQESSLCVALAGLLDHAQDRSTTPPLGKEHSGVQQAREYLEAYYARNVSLEELAQVATLNPFYLIRVFHEQVGLPPHAYQIQARVRHARALLLSGMSLGDIALETGFFDQSHLARCFKRIVGIAPAAYRKSIIS